MRRNFSEIYTLSIIAALLLAGPALAGSSGPSGEVIAKFVLHLDGVGGSSPDGYLVDNNGNFVWDGGAGGDSTTIIAPGTSDPAMQATSGTDDALCKYLSNGTETLIFCDQNKNSIWDGNGGGDVSTNFSPTTGAGVVFYADANNNGTKELIKYVPDLSGGQDAYLIDWNENNVWDGSATDRTWRVSANSGPGEPFGCDCDGNGTIEIGKYIPSSASVFIDLNNNGLWEGNGGGDSSSTFSVGTGGVDTSIVFGEIGGSGVLGDVLAKYLPDSDGAGAGDTDLYQIDLNGNRIWNGSPDDLNGVVAPGSAPGTPNVINPDGSGDVLMKSRDDSQVFVDLNGNYTWDGNAGGDSSSTYSTVSGPGQYVVIAVPAGS
jgi:hypothetical protein